jgi:hypothetical protein
MTLARGFVAPGAVLFALLLSAGQAPAQAEPIPAGTWRFVPEQSDNIERSIDQAVSHLNFLIRGIARNRLRNANAPVRRLIIQYPDSDVYISFREDEPPTISPRDGAVVPYTRADGEVVRIHTELGDRRIRQFFDSDDGQKEHVFSMRPDGTMAMEVTVFSERLREPFRYTWVFRR